MIGRLIIAAIHGALLGFGLGAVTVAFFLIEGSAQVSPSAVFSITMMPAFLFGLAFASHEVAQ